MISRWLNRENDLAWVCVVHRALFITFVILWIRMGKQLYIQSLSCALIYRNKVLVVFKTSIYQDTNLKWCKIRSDPITLLLSPCKYSSKINLDINELYTCPWRSLFGWMLTEVLEHASYWTHAYFVFDILWIDGINSLYKSKFTHL